MQRVVVAAHMLRAQGVEIRHSAYLSILCKVPSMSLGGMLLINMTACGNADKPTNTAPRRYRYYE